MHLRTLTFQAVGPFAGSHTIDFAELGAGGIFLLEGPTGAGKSTLIDMIVFALYGKVASREASEDRLRSGHATPDVETFVDLVLETSAGIYRVRRTPAYQRPKQRGTGTTTQQASVKLWRLTSTDAPDDGELLSNRLDEAGLELQKAIGLDRDQFVQTIVLPQGEFAGFLRAKPEDRRGLLQKVFYTGIYEQVQTRLEAMRAEVKRQVDDAAAHVRQATAAFAGSAGLDPDSTVDLTTAADSAFTGTDGAADLADLATGHVERLHLAAETATVVARDAKDACSVTQAALDEAKALAAALERRRTLRAEHTALLARAAEVTAATARRDAARRATQVTPQLDAVDTARTALDRALTALDTATDAAPDDVRDADTDALTTTRDQCTGLLAVLDTLADVEAALPRRRAEAAAAEARAQELAVERSGLEHDRDGRPDARQHLHDTLADVRTQADGLPAAEAAVTAAEERLAAADDVAALTAETTRAEEQLTQLATAAQQAVETEATVRAARIAGIAGELAETLAPGDACPVCGGTEHPAPATTGPDHVGPEQVDAAEQARRAAEEAVGRAGATLSDLRARLQTRRDAAGGLDQDAAKAELLAAQDAAGRARAAVRRHTELEAQLVRFDADTVALEQRITALGLALAEHTARATSLRQQIDADTARVTAALDGCPTVADRAAAVRDRARRAGALLDAHRAVADARAAHTQRCAEQDEALRRHGFPDATAARAAALPDTQLRRLEAQVQEHERALHRVTDALAAPDLIDLAEDATADVTGAAAAHAAADTAATQAAQEAARLTDRAHAATEALDRLLAALSAAEKVRADAVPVVRMANLAGAAGTDNTKQLTLATYVLARRFEDVVAAANSRLVTMSGGRFELIRSEDKEAVRTRRTGLAMKVIDHHTETERDPRTLSGGETFYVSLCLALGLADVVTAEAGGTDLGTLFIDEGFGTLDPETLDVVLGELGRLRDGGRVVGVVSHVDALKQAIAERIEIRRHPSGGSTLTVRA